MTLLLTALILVLIAFSAFFSSSEIAYAKANRFRIDKACENGDRTARLEQFICTHYVRTLSTVLVGNDLVNIAASSAATMLFAHVLRMTNGETLASVVITVLLLIFGESLPKIIVSEMADTAARAYARPLRALMRVFYPVVWATEKLVRLLSPLWTPREEPDVTTDELVELVDNIEDEGVFSEEEGELIRSAIEITDTMAMDIMIPRVDMVALDIEDGLPEIDEGMLLYSRIPVYRETIDNIVGILNVKKWVKAAASGQTVRMEDLLTPPMFVHKTRMISSIIREFRDRHIQLAIVVDEWGGTLGMMTMEDIMEEIVGDIYDERDDVEDEIVRINDTTFIVDGDANIEDLFDACDWEPEEFDSEYSTVGGLVTELLDRFPRPGDTVEYGRLALKVLEVHKLRVEKVKAVLRPEPEE